MGVVEVCYKGSTLNRFSGEDAMLHAREDAQEHANRNDVHITLVFVLPGQPRQFLEEVEPSIC